MATRNGSLDRARRRMADDERRVRSDLAAARRAAGLSQDVVGAACGWSGSTQARIEGGSGSSAQLAAIGAVVGRDVRLAVFPAGDPLRDAGHVRLLGRLRARRHPDLRWATEVPLGIDHDLRAWDAEITGRTWRCRVEAETVLDDAQALERRLALKRRDGGADRLILLLADTKRNRRALATAEASGALSSFPARSREILAALARGEPPPSGIVLL